MNVKLKKTALASAVLLALGLGALPISAQAGICWPGINGCGEDDTGGGGTPTDEELQAKYDEGYADGKVDGIAEGHAVGYAEGYDAGVADGKQQGIEGCHTAPESCGINLYTFLDNTGFGETEPNDKAYSADGLVFGESYHANSYDYFDEDWYYVTTTADNQNLTITFLGDNASTVTEGWLISVKDAYGNILATFDSTNPGTDTNVGGGGEFEITEGRTMVVTVGNPGAYYIVVTPKEDATGDSAGSFKAYSIGALVSDPGQVSPNPDTNFMDVEKEPNDVRAQATALSSTTNMFAYFSKELSAGTVVGSFDFDSDWFKYVSSGNEIVNLRMCSKESCGKSEQPEVTTTEFGRIWHLEVQDSNGNVLLTGPIQPGQAINAAITYAGTYYVHFSPEPTGELICSDGGEMTADPTDPEAKNCLQRGAQVIPIVNDASGAYNFTVTGTSLSPTTP